MVDVIIPIYRPTRTFFELLGTLLEQTMLPDKVIIPITENNDYGKNRLLSDLENRFKWNGTSICKAAKTDHGVLMNRTLVEIISIRKEDFDHGTTRRLAANMSEAKYMLFMTQDAVPKDECLIKRLYESFSDDDVAVAYARQVARGDADATERYVRSYNYPDRCIRKTKDDVTDLGIKTYFSSNVCAMYRKSIYKEIGGFKKDMILNEDMTYCASVINKGYAVYYDAKAIVIHSHDYSLMEQFKRNFDIGVSQKMNEGMYNGVKSEKEGKKLLLDMMAFHMRNDDYVNLAYSLVQSMYKYVGFVLGRHYKRLPKKVVLKCTSNVGYWDKEH